MTREALDAVLAERYGPPVRQKTGTDGPTAEWLRQQAVDEAEKVVDSSEEDP